MKYMLSCLIIIACISCNKKAIIPEPYSYNRNYQLANSPEAWAKNDSNALGIYKGVAINSIDSLCTFKFNIKNNNNGVFGLLYINNIIRDSLLRYSLNVGDVQHPKEEDTTSIDLKLGFTGNFHSYHPEAGATALFGVNPYGSAVSNIQFYDNYAISAVIKEKSNNQVFCFEGTFSGIDNGKIAFVVSSDMAINIGTSRKTGTSFKNSSSVNISSGKFILNGQIPNLGLIVFNATYDSNVLSGTWTLSSNPTINTFYCNRTL